MTHDLQPIEDRLQDVADAVEAIAAAMSEKGEKDEKESIVVQAKAPVVNLHPHINVEATKPTKWEFSVTERDNHGRISKFTATPQK